jgi:lysophospholipase L1-like esterase
MSGRRLTEILFLIFVPLALFFLVSELVLRAYLSSHIFYNVEMSRYALTLKVDSPNPLIGHHHRPNGEATLMGVSVRTNSDGFRDDEYSVAKGEKHRIIFLGDSLTLAWGVEKQDSFEQHLEDRLNAVRPTEVINLGVGNYNTTQEVNLLIDKGLKYQPDQVVLFYFINDAEPMPRKSRFPGLGYSRTVTFFWSRLKAMKARFTETTGYKEVYSGHYLEDRSGWQATQDSFRTLHQLSAEHGFSLSVVLLPELHELRDYAFAKEHAQVMALVSEIGIPALDLAEEFQHEPNPQSLWVSLDDAHPNARAHALISDYSFEFVLEGGS